jgi:hypothetical protein
VLPDSDLVVRWTVEVVEDLRFVRSRASCARRSVLNSVMEGVEALMDNAVTKFSKSDPRPWAIYITSSESGTSVPILLNRSARFWILLRNSAQVDPPFFIVCNWSFRSKIFAIDWDEWRWLRVFQTSADVWHLAIWERIEGEMELNSHARINWSCWIHNSCSGFREFAPFVSETNRSGADLDPSRNPIRPWPLKTG